MKVLACEMTLVSNGTPLCDAPNRLGRLTPTDPARPRSALWGQYQAQGYLWLRGILDRRSVLDFRRRYFAAFVEAGVPLLAPGTDPAEGICGEGAMDVDPALSHRVLAEIVRWAEYEAFCLMEPIRRFYEAFLEGAPYLHKRKLIRQGEPGDRHCTGAHYDLIYLRGGTDRICTSWIPIGDVPAARGGARPR
jgi:hypothetical protein